MARARFPSDNERYTVSLPEGMKNRLKSAASENNRTLNAEIVTRLQASFWEHDNNGDFSSITCSQCGAVCSQPVFHPGTVIRTFIQCSECCQKENKHQEGTRDEHDSH